MTDGKRAFFFSFSLIIAVTSGMTGCSLFRNPEPDFFEIHDRLLDIYYTGTLDEAQAAMQQLEQVADEHGGRRPPRFNVLAMRRYFYLRWYNLYLHRGELEEAEEALNLTAHWLGKVVEDFADMSPASQKVLLIEELILIEAERPPNWMRQELLDTALEDARRRATMKQEARTMVVPALRQWVMARFLPNEIGNTKGT